MCTYFFHISIRVCKVCWSKKNEECLYVCDYSWILVCDGTFAIKATLQISLVMASWLLEALPLPLSISISLSLVPPPPYIDPPLLPCMSCGVSGSCKVSIFRQRSGWLKSYMERSARHNMKEVFFFFLPCCFYIVNLRVGIMLGGTVGL